jgi:hypothetical protein
MPCQPPLYFIGLESETDRERGCRMFGMEVAKLKQLRSELKGVGYESFLFSSNKKAVFSNG